MDFYVRLARYTLEKNVLVKFPSAEKLIIPANILCYYWKSLATFLSENRRAYVVDPVSFLFQFPESMDKIVNEEQDSGEKVSVQILKKSFEKLLAEYDRTVIDYLNIHERLEPKFFESPKNLESFVKSTLDYQLHTLENAQTKVRKYEAMLEEPETGFPLGPEQLVAPYFYFETLQDPWYRITVSGTTVARSVAGEDKHLLAVLCFDRLILNDPSAVSTIANDFRSADGFLVHISGFDERQCDDALLRQFMSFVLQLASNTGKPVTHLYSQYFSAILAGQGVLSGICFGLCVSETRSATHPTMAGQATIRYYVPHLHSKLSESVAKAFLVKRVDDIVCSCELCADIKRILGGVVDTAKARVLDAYFNQTEGLLPRALEHFMINRLSELKLASQSLEPILRNLEEGSSIAEKNGYSDLGIHAEHLDTWRKALKP